MSAGAVLRSRRSPRPRATGTVLPYAAVALAAASWGTWGLIIRKTLSFGPMPAALESAIVMAIVAAVCGGVAAAGRRRPGSRGVPAEGRAARSWRDWALVAWFGVGDVLNVLLFFAAYRLTIAVAVLAHYMTPVIVALTAPLVLRERMTVRTAIAILASFAGLGVMLAPARGAAGGPDSAAVWTSAALGLASAFFYASNVLVNKFITRAFSATEAMSWHGVFGAAVGLSLVPRGDWAVIDARGVAFLAIAAVGPGALGGLAFVWGLRRMPAAHASTLTLLEPVVSLFLGAAVLGERVGPAAFAGGALILLGAIGVITQPAAADAAPARTDPA